MRIAGLIWFEDIVEKLIRKHNVYQTEIREVLANRPYFRFVEKGHRSGEDVYAAMGQSDSGRYLLTFFVYRKDSRALILSARDMTPAERKRYDQR
ncbi:MAG: BrnT family toxin [Pseudomonadota bacterium]